MEIIDQIIEVYHRAGWGSPERAVALFALKTVMAPETREVLWQLMFRGPVRDGDVVSKAARDKLLDWNLATRCCFHGEQGYSIATYPAYAVAKALGFSKDPACLARGSAET